MGVVDSLDKIKQIYSVLKNNNESEKLITKTIEESKYQIYENFKRSNIIQKKIINSSIEDILNVVG